MLHNHTAKNLRNVLVHLVHLGLGTLQVVWALVFSCVSLPLMPCLFAMACVLEEVDHLSSLISPFHPLLVLVNYNGVRIERERNFPCL
jgi:hypothetical protein